MSGLFDHVMAVAGWPLPTVNADRLMRPGSPVTFVSWDGCMAHIRNERGAGTITRRCNNRDIFGPKADSIDIIVVRMPDGKDRYASLQNLRVVGGKLEVWE